VLEFIRLVLIVQGFDNDEQLKVTSLYTSYNRQRNWHASRNKGIEDKEQTNEEPEGLCYY